MSYNALAIQAVYAGGEANRGIQETESRIVRLGTTATVTATKMQSSFDRWAQSMTQSRVGQILEAQRSAQAKVADVTEQTAKAATLGGEKLARYATVIGLTTGQFQRLGIQGEVLARIFAVGGDLAMGLTGPWGAALIGAGALATAIGALVNRQRELKQATEEATAKLVEQANQSGRYGELSDIPSVSETIKEDLTKALEERLELIEKIAEAERKANAPWFGAVPGGRERWNREATRLRAELVAKQQEILSLQTALGVGITTLPGVHFTYTNVMPGIRSGIGAIPIPGLPRTTGPMEMPAERDAGYRQPMSMREVFYSKPFDKYELFSIGGKDALDKVEKFAKEAKELLRKAKIAEVLEDGIYGAFQAGKRGVDELGNYLLDYFTNNILKALSEKIAMSLAGSLAGGGGFISALFTGSFGGDKDLGGAKSMNLEWRRARG